MYLEGRNYRSVIGNAVLLYMYNGTALYYIFYVTSRHTFFFFSHGSN